MSDLLGLIHTAIAYVCATYRNADLHSDARHVIGAKLGYSSNSVSRIGKLFNDDK